MGLKPRKKPIKALTCIRADRHASALICGYPLPCPYHTIIITEDKLFGDSRLRIN